MRTCWKQLSSFRNISTAMKSRYDKAVPIARKFNGKLKRKGKAKKKGPISLDSLVYLERSPNYCKLDYANGIRGTSGRTCNATFNGPGSCNYVCCNRGHQTQVVRKIERCYCKFIYCCKVECKECKTTKEISTCN
ncbi:protein Wnt-16-like [Paramacrobiotus metropolitanus]|uniref:protein Wnt-16-like n=1 Tax=Paramacrobiotus metropolitanus TaxID=2943436 RepID=UPI002445B7E7|nr:protein Wnt-16-like [Paramacrobiotus metropolitanus]